eukprot:6175867-Pleurochrysis_carterae.AAC.1
MLKPPLPQALVVATSRHKARPSDLQFARALLARSGAHGHQQPYVMRVSAPSAQRERGGREAAEQRRRSPKAAAARARHGGSKRRRESRGLRGRVQ